MTNTTEIGFYRVPQICELLCISKSTWWLWTKNNKAPKGIKISNGVTVWQKSVIHQFMKNVLSTANIEPKKVTIKTHVDDYSHIETLAKRATQGTWAAVGRQVENIHDNLPDICFCNLSNDQKQDAINADYIAAAQPKVVLDLIYRLRQYQKNTQLKVE